MCARHWRHAVCIAALSVLLTAAALPATRYVPDDYPAIQAAIVAAADGDTILVRPGRYVENIDFGGEDDPRIAAGTVDIGADEFYRHLYYRGAVVPGTAIRIRTVGLPADRVILAEGSGIVDPPVPTPYGDLYLQAPPVKHYLGLIPASGVLNVAVTVPSAWVPGEAHPLPALNGRTLSNLMVLHVE